MLPFSLFSASLNVHFSKLHLRSFVLNGKFISVDGYEEFSLRPLSEKNNAGRLHVPNILSSKLFSIPPFHLLMRAVKRLINSDGA